MISLKTPRGVPVDVPETIDEGPTVRFTPNDHAGIRRYYEENGYVVVSGLINPAICDNLRQIWERDVKTSDRFIYRQTTCKAERHVFNERGWVMNPILNLQSVDPAHLGDFRTYATEQLLTGKPLSSTFRALFDDDPKVVQSMYFEGNSATWEHQDSYYLDSERIGTMVGAWIAIESIDAQAGRFFICPGSHRLYLERHNRHNNVADNHEIYIQSVVNEMRQLGLEIRAPRLEKGDVLFWNAFTIHGSLDNSQDSPFSRSSVTCHAIPTKDKFLQFQIRTMEIPTDIVNGVAIWRPKDQAKAKNRAVLWIESNFPKQFYWLKRIAIRHLSSLQSKRKATA